MRGGLDRGAQLLAPPELPRLSALLQPEDVRPLVRDDPPDRGRPVRGRLLVARSAGGPAGVGPGADAGRGPGYRDLSTGPRRPESAEGRCPAGRADVQADE